MSGTSMDAVDVALVSFNNQTELHDYQEFPIQSSLRKQIRSLNGCSPLSEIVEMDQILGKLFADSINHLIEHNSIPKKDIVAIGSHGQTIFHEPNASLGSSIQIGNPNIICAQTGITTVGDFRRMDMAKGGQGAPLASHFHQYQFQQDNQALAILNIGGMANITYLPASVSKNVITGFDSGPGNALLDDWIQYHRNKEYDVNSLWANSGTVNDSLLESMLNDPYFSVEPPKSTGRDYFNLAWVQQFLAEHTDLRKEDVQATLLALTIKTIVDALNRFANDCSSVVICGGGAYNQQILDTLNKSMSDKIVNTTKRFDLHPNCIEAVSFAWLAKRRMQNLPGNIPGVTGASEDMALGAVYALSQRKN